MNDVKFTLQLSEDLLLGLSILRDEKQLTLDAHFRARAEVKFEFFVVTDAEGEHGELCLDAHLGEVAHEHGDFIGDLFDEEIPGHFPDGTVFGVELGCEVGGETMRDVLPLVHQLVILPLNVQQGDYCRVIYHLSFADHLTLLLQQHLR